jgi:hypothetical protein
MRCKRVGLCGDWSQLPYSKFYEGLRLEAKCEVTVSHGVSKLDPPFK